MIKIIYYKDKCIGCFYCVDIDPENWSIDDKEGKSFLIDSVEKNGIFIKKIADFDYQINKQVADSCPVNAIKIEKNNN